MRACHASEAVYNALLAVSSLHKTFKEGTNVSPTTPSKFITLAEPGHNSDPSQDAFASEHHGSGRIVSGIGSSNFIISSEPGTNPNPPQDVYASEHYGKALRLLFQETFGEKNSCSQSTVLVCAALFILIEVLQENDLCALSHLDSALKLLHQSTFLKGSYQPIHISEDHEQLVSLFSALDLEASIYTGLRRPGLHAEDIRRNENIELRPDEFASLADAFRNLNIITNSSLHFQRTADDYRYRVVGNVPLQLLAEQQDLLERFRRWKTAYDCFCANHDHVSFDQSSKRQTLLHRIHFSMTFTILYGCLSVNETLYDSLHSHFRDIVRYSNEILALDAFSQSGTQAHRPKFSLETGIIWPLFETAQKCRDRQLRRQALSLIRVAPREGVWVPEIHARVSERVIEIEEDRVLDWAHGDFHGASCQFEDIPEWRRIHSVNMNPHKSERLVEVKYRRRLNGIDGEWDDFIEWVQY